MVVLARSWAPALVMAVVMACSPAEEVQLYGAVEKAEELNSRARPVSSLGPGDSGSEVVVSGVIGRVCQTMGCWFYVTEGPSMVYVDLEQGSRFTIPIDSAGRRAMVAGRYVADGGDTRIVARSAAVWP